jgi:predicted glycogen debranching enzyme
MLRLEANVVRDLAKAAELEWLLADGLGGYASSTVVGLNTRRYHGLLVAARRPPVDRMVLLSRLEEALTVGERRHDLGTNTYAGGVVHPRGYERAFAFELDPLPTLTFEVDGGRLSRTVARVHGAPATAVVYAYEGPGPATLELRPLLAYRDHHALQRENPAVRREAQRAGEDVVLAPFDGCPPLHLRLAGAAWDGESSWYHGFEYAREKERGLDFTEDLWSPGVLRVPLRSGKPWGLLAWAGPIPEGRTALLAVTAERTRLRAIGGGSEGLLGHLRRAAEAFLVRRGEVGRTIVAGYHWFADWGRDTMIALPGLCLTAGRPDVARTILTEFARHVDAGMIPNRFPDGGEPPEYNAADASLWMVVAVHRLVEATGDHAFARLRMKATVAAILDGYKAGTRHGIRMTPDGLLAQGEDGVQLTWMDAKVGDWVVTPRRGHAVEIQALWYNALLIGADLAREAGETQRAAEWAAIAVRVRESFLRAFWSESLGYLADVVAGGTKDLSLRPNQLYAIGLPHALLPRDKALRVLDVVKRHLLTPVGLRSLAPSDPQYQGRYDGGPRSRDAGYHQGTVWPYLIGIYFDAVIRLHGEEGKAAAREWLGGFAPHLREAGLATVSEVFDGDPPHRPGGAIAQAWSVAELLRVAGRLDLRRPRFPPRADDPPI